MADLIVTFTHAQIEPPRAPILPAAVGSVARTETIAIGGSSVPGDKAATKGDNIVELLAEAECWIAIGPTPVAAAGSCRKLLEGERVAYLVRPGDKVAVIEAAS